MTAYSTTFSWMLDTNALGALISRRHPQVEERVAQLAADEICISVITEAEVLFGLAKNPNMSRAARAMRQAVSRFTILPWSSSAATIYGALRADLQRQGRTLGALDMLIAAHALEVGATLVSADGAFRFVPGLTVENWLE